MSPFPEFSVEANALSLKRGVKTLFQGLDFSLSGGQVLHLKGSNGVGKSSLLRAIAGFLTPSEGSLLLKTDGSNTEPNTLIALVEEQAALKPAETLYETLQNWAAMMGETATDKAIDHAAHMLSIPNLLMLETRRFSTGQRKRAALCRLALTTRPLWLLDEPLNGLDNYSRTVVKSMMQNHVSKGGAIIVAAHEGLSRVEIGANGKTIELDSYAPREKMTSINADVANIDIESLEHRLEENW